MEEHKQTNVIADNILVNSKWVGFIAVGNNQPEHKYSTGSVPISTDNADLLPEALVD